MSEVRGGFRSIGLFGLMASMVQTNPAICDRIDKEIPSEKNSRKGRMTRMERLYSAVFPKDKAGKSMKELRVLPSGSAYRVHSSGAWLRINHPKNKHDRRNRQLSGWKNRKIKRGGL